MKNNNKLYQMKKMIQNRILKFAVIFLSLQTTYGQSDWSVSVGGQFAIAELEVNNSTFSSNSQPGTGLLLGVSYAINEQWSLNSGVGFSYLESTTTISRYTDTQTSVDIEGEEFEFRYQLDGFRERQKTTILSIPLTVQYESKGVTRFYGRLGASYNLFLGSDSEGEATSLNTTGFFERFNGELDSPKFAGFGSFSDIEFSEQEFELENSINATLELGVKQQIIDSQWIYIGFFASFGINDIHKTEKESLVEFNTTNPTDFIINSSLNAIDQSTGKSFLEKANLNLIGVRLRYEFNL